MNGVESIAIRKARLASWATARACCALARALRRALHAVCQRVSGFTGGSPIRALELAHGRPGGRGIARPPRALQGVARASRFGVRWRADGPQKRGRLQIRSDPP